MKDCMEGKNNINIGHIFKKETKCGRFRIRTRPLPRTEKHFLILKYGKYGV
jgi:hypothetical protein